MLVSVGIRNLGFPFRLDMHTEDLTESAARAIIAEIPNDITAFVITYLRDPSDISELCKSLGVATVQLHGPVNDVELEELRLLRPDLTVIKSLIVASGRPGWHADQLFDEAESLGPLVDAFITDTFDPQTGASGATGKTHDWSLSRELAETAGRPLILAGGLNADNVAEAIESVRPAAVDVHTGIEDARGRKDVTATRAFLEAASKAFAGIEPT